MEIQITQQDIDQGVQRDGLNCPISRALGRYTANTVWGVGNDWIFVAREYMNPAHRYRLSEEAQQFIITFDHSGKGAVKPFTLIIDGFEWECTPSPIAPEHYVQSQLEPDRYSKALFLKGMMTPGEVYAMKPMYTTSYYSTEY